MFCELGFYFSIHVILFQGKSGFLAKGTGVSFGYSLGILYENGCRLQEKACFLRRVSYTRMERCSSRSMDRTQSCEDCNPGSTPGWGIMKH